MHEQVRPRRSPSCCRPPVEWVIHGILLAATNSARRPGRGHCSGWGCVPAGLDIIISYHGIFGIRS